MLSDAASVLQTPPVVSTMSPLSLGDDLAIWGAAPVSGAWNLAKRVFYVPFWLQKPTTITQLFVCNGATASGNFDIGIYTSTAAFLPGTKVIGTGSTGQVGTGVLQAVDTTDTLLAPGLYFMALTMDGTTGTVFRTALTATQFLRMAAATFIETTALFGLPATAAAGANLNQNFFPLFGFATVAVI